jgi:hypothetical protein
MSLCDNTSTINQGQMRNTWTDRIGVRMSQGHSVKAGGSFRGRTEWVEMSHGRWTNLSRHRDGAESFTE